MRGLGHSRLAHDRSLISCRSTTRRYGSQAVGIAGRGYRIAPVWTRLSESLAVVSTSQEATPLYGSAAAPRSCWAAAGPVSASVAGVLGRLGCVTDDAERERLARTFDQAADLYQRARPDYPSELYDRLVEVTDLDPGSALLEIGCATGKATLPLARRGYRITCLEPGRALAAEARRILAAFDVKVIETRFEDWQEPEGRFSLVYAATAWHWLDPLVRYHKAAHALTPGGFLAFWEAAHVIPYDGDRFFEEIQEIYDEIGEGLPDDFMLPRPQELDDQRPDIESSGLFGVVEIRQYDWETTHDAESYIDLLRTFSGHIAMENWQRDRLYGEIRRRLALRPDGRLRRHWGGVFHIAQRQTR